MKTTFFVTYEGIHHSVFASQVLQPLLNSVNQDPEQRIFIISFEKQQLSETELNKFPKHNRLSIILCRRLPFFGKLSLRSAIIQLKRLIKNYDPCKIIARGPLAAAVCLYTTRQVLVQARGLLAQEYTATHETTNYIKKFFYWLRAQQFEHIERFAFQARKHVIIEAVTPALKDYLCSFYQSDPHRITIAHDDIPAPIEQEQRLQWRTAVREKAGIAPEATVYCYSGSLEPWQCPELVIKCFVEAYEKNKNSFLLVLTQQQWEFDVYLQKAGIPKNRYYLMSVAHHEIYQYLAACDIGFSFRKPHLISWVSRPVKAMEYQAVGLKIMHNNTVAWLIEQENLKNY